MVLAVLYSLVCLVLGVSQCCATFLGFMRRVFVTVKIWFGENSIYALYLILHLNLWFLFDFLPFVYMIWWYLLFICEMIGTVSMVCNRWFTCFNTLQWRILLLSRCNLDLIHRLHHFHIVRQPLKILDPNLIEIFQDYYLKSNWWLIFFVPFFSLFRHSPFCSFHSLSYLFLLVEL